MKKSIGLVGLYALPFLAFAQNPFLNIVQRIRDILDAIVPLLITLALIYFIYGVAKFATSKEAADRDTARDIMIYGAIGLFAIVSIWGIVVLLQQFTGVQPGVTPFLPSVPLR